MNKRKHPKDSQFNVRVTPLELEILRRRSQEEDNSISNIVRRELIRAGILAAPELQNKS